MTKGSPRQTITGDQFAAAYELGRQWLNGVIDKSVAVKMLHETHGMNSGSAGIYLNALKALLEGVVFKKTISAPCADLWLQNFSETGDSAELVNALTSLELHIPYYENLGKKKSPYKKMRAVAEKWRSNIAAANPEDWAQQL